MRTNDTSSHPKHVTHEDIIGPERNASASSVDDHQMSFPERHSLKHGEEVYIPSTIDHDREDFDADHLHGAPC